jgi:hypothetical protein
LEGKLADQAQFSTESLMNARVPGRSARVTDDIKTLIGYFHDLHLDYNWNPAEVWVGLAPPQDSRIRDWKGVAIFIVEYCSEMVRAFHWSDSCWSICVECHYWLRKALDDRCHHLPFIVESATQIIRLALGPDSSPAEITRKIDAMRQSVLNAPDRDNDKPMKIHRRKRSQAVHRILCEIVNEELVRLSGSA